MTVLVFVVLITWPFHPSSAQDERKGIEVIPSTRSESQSDSSYLKNNEQDLLSLSSFVDSSGIRKLSLEKIIKLAVEHNRILKRYRLSGDAAKIRLKQAEYRFLPSAYINAGRTENTNVSLGQVERTRKLNSRLGFYRALETGGSVSVNMNNSTNESSANVGIVNYSSGLNIAVSQPLLAGRGIKVNHVPIERAKDYAKTSMLYVKQNLINLITRIESTYWDLILVYKDYDIQKDALKRAKELLEVNKSLIESGRMASQEIVQTESDIASREITVAGAENAIISTQINLQEQLDLGERILIQPTTKMEFKPVSISVKDCLARAYKNRPDWLINELYLEINRMNLMVAKNNNQYTLGSSASIGSDVTSDHSMEKAFRDAMTFKELSWNVGLSFVVPFNKQVLENNYQIYLISYRQQKIYVDELQDDIRIAVENSVRNVQFSLKQVGLARRAKQLAQKKLNLEEEKMKVGRSSNFQVISYQRDLTNAQNEELRRIAGYLKALGYLEQTMGTTLEKWGIKEESVE
ncbi:MAG: TolC family protein [Calditrichaeota bacterium]|nr:TolC family protein [Calditrichota bacterium]